MKKTKKKSNINKRNYIEEGLTSKWVLFINEYFNNGFNATKAYMKIYEIKKQSVARAAATRLLTNVSIRSEINYRLTQQTVTDAYIVSNLWEISQYRDSRRINAAVSALGLLARTRGMLKEKVQHEFTNENPAIVTLPISMEEAKEILRTSKRIEE